MCEHLRRAAAFATAANLSTSGNSLKCAILSQYEAASAGETLAYCKVPPKKAEGLTASACPVFHYYVLKNIGFDEAMKLLDEMNGIESPEPQ